MSNQLKDFERIDFPTKAEIVYVVFFLKGENEQYFYVGQSTRHIGRLGDYISANFTAATDFKVGQAIKYLREKGFSVGVAYEETTNSKEKEQGIAQELRQLGFKLLNDLPGYDYRTARQDDEKRKIRGFMTRLSDSQT